jgi:hypothetical protein
MYGHSRHLWAIACEARDRAAQAVSENSEVLPADATVALIMAAVAVEAFINELGESLAMRRDDGRESMSAPLLACANALEEIEDSRGSLQLKYIVAFNALGKSVNKGEKAYQDFATLVTLRNDLVHLKPRDKFEIESGGNHVVHWPKHIEALGAKGLARRHEPEVGMSWFNALQTNRMAAWACETAINIILAVLALIPNDPAGPGYFLKFLFRAEIASGGVTSDSA